MSIQWQCSGCGNFFDWTSKHICWGKTDTLKDIAGTKNVGVSLFEPLFKTHILCDEAMKAMALNINHKINRPCEMAFKKFLPEFQVDSQNLFFTATGVAAAGYFGVRCRFNIQLFPAIHDTFHAACHEIRVRGYWETLGDGLLILDRCDRVIVID